MIETYKDAVELLASGDLAVRNGFKWQNEFKAKKERALAVYDALYANKIANLALGETHDYVSHVKDDPEPKLQRLKDRYNDLVEQTTALANITKDSPTVTDQDPYWDHIVGKLPYWQLAENSLELIRHAPQSHQASIDVMTRDIITSLDVLLDTVPQLEALYSVSKQTSSKKAQRGIEETTRQCEQAITIVQRTIPMLTDVIESGNNRFVTSFLSLYDPVYERFEEIKSNHS
jgi:hypothetical protein